MYAPHSHIFLYRQGAESGGRADETVPSTQGGSWSSVGPAPSGPWLCQPRAKVRPGQTGQRMPQQNWYREPPKAERPREGGSSETHWETGRAHSLQRVRSRGTATTETRTGDRRWVKQGARHRFAEGPGKCCRAAGRRARRQARRGQKEEETGDSGKLQAALPRSGKFIFLHLFAS